MREVDDDFDELAAVDELLDDEVPEGGMCRVCGCTDDAACGCIWATPAADLCSRCARGAE